MSTLVYIALLHYPVYNKQGKEVVTSIANFDLHDIARCARTYGVKGYYIINPVASQQYLGRRIMEHWQKGHGAAYNASRKVAFETTRFTATLAETLQEIEKEAGSFPKLVVTDAKVLPDNVSYQKLRQLMKADGNPWLILFGTGWGLTAEVLAQADYKLAPVLGNSDYNHLSVRSAAAIILDRLLAEDR